MNGPCSLHPDSFISNGTRVVEARVADSPRLLRATRKTVYQRYCEDFAINSETVIYEETEDLLAIAHQCAATILADQCPMYVLAESVLPGKARIVTRTTLQKYPDRYEQII